MPKGRRVKIPDSLASVVAEHLEREIIEGRVRPGERLREQKWAAEFGISRGSFREVLRILANAGLVEILPRRGARVGTLSKKDVEEIYFLRKHLESLAAARAAENMSEDRLAEFERILARMEQAAKRTDLSMYVTYNQLFQQRLVEAAGIERLKTILEHTGKPALRYRFLGLELPGRIATSLRAHREIVRAFARRDGERAAKANFELLETAAQAITAQLFKGSEAGDGSVGRARDAGVASARGASRGAGTAPKVRDGRFLVPRARR